jgi:RimJ/RimL family protein N-acetyltransferase
MTGFIFGHDEQIANWVAQRLGFDGFGPCTAIGIMLGDEFVAGAVYHDYQPKFKTIQMSIATTTPRWASRGRIRALLAYPFDQLGVFKIWTASPSKSARTLKFLRGVGFRQEAVMGRQFGDDHAVICRMYRPDFIRLYKES